MIRSINKITLSDIAILYRTKNANHLKSFKWIPFFIVKKRLNKLISGIHLYFNGEVPDDISEGWEKLKFSNEIFSLQILLRVLEIEFDYTLRASALRVSISKKIKESENLKEAIKRIKKETGIEIKEPKDISDFIGYLKWQKDKYYELYPDEIETETESEDEKNDVDIISIMYKYFRFMNMDYNENMSFLTFISLKKMADKESVKRKLNG